MTLNTQLHKSITGHAVAVTSRILNALCLRMGATIATHSCTSRNMTKLWSTVSKDRTHFIEDKQGYLLSRQKKSEIMPVNNLGLSEMELSETRFFLEALHLPNHLLQKRTYSTSYTITVSEEARTSRASSAL